MFYNCENLESIDLSSFNTSNVTNMSNMFYDCSKLENLDLSNFDTSNLTGYQYLLTGCYNLKTLDLSSFNLQNGTSMSLSLSYSNLLRKIKIRETVFTQFPFVFEVSVQ